MRKLKKGQLVTIDVESDWKYGEPSIYSDEYMEYLVITVEGVILDWHEDELDVLKQLGLDYHAILHGKYPITLPLTIKVGGKKVRKQVVGNIRAIMSKAKGNIS